MSVIYLNAAHTALSPGAVWHGKTEHGETLRFCHALKRELLFLDSDLDVRVTEGNFPLPYVMHDDFLFVLHKGINGKNENRHGASIYVKDTDSAATQYKAFRLLEALCGKRLKYLGVHVAGKRTPFRFFVNTAAGNAYLIMAGFMESSKDLETMTLYEKEIAAALSREILKIYKEKTDEDYT